MPQKGLHTANHPLTWALKHHLPILTRLSVSWETCAVTHPANLLAYSTANRERRWSPRRYLSAEHATNFYCASIGFMEGLIAIDLSKAYVQCQPQTENPHIDAMSDCWLLEEVFRDARNMLSRSARRALPRPLTREDLVKAEAHAELQWKVWCEARVALSKYRKCWGVSKSTALYFVERVDDVVEQALADAGLLFPSRVDLHAAPCTWDDA
jgi:hypothetical protein